MRKNINKKGVGIGTGVFFWFAGASLLIIILLWATQIFLFDFFYQDMMTHRMRNAADDLQKSFYEEDRLPTNDDVAKAAREGQYSLSLFRMTSRDGGVYPEILLTSLGTGSASDSLATREYRNLLRVLYKDITENENGIFRTYLPEDKFFYTDDTSRLLYAYVLIPDTGAPLMAVFDCPMRPLPATRDVITYQLSILSALILVIAVVASYFVSRHLTRPLVRITRAAKTLPRGEYTDPGQNGFLEISDLSNTLEKAAEELHVSDRYQKELIANVSHDLRTPLTMIIGYGEVMRDIESERTPENVQVVIDEARRLSTIVNDLLELSRYQTGNRAEDRREVFDLSREIGETVERYRRMKAAEDFRFTYDGAVSAPVYADKGKIMQVFCNLMNNAINYSGDSRDIEIGCRVTDGTTVTVSVSDHGVGIAPEDMDRVFDRYYKVDKTHTRGRIGTGIGLSIVKEILDGYGTLCEVKSTPGEGSTFRFTLPVALYGEERRKNGEAIPGN